MNQRNKSNCHHYSGRILLFLILGPLAITGAFAQHNLQPGSIVTKTKDTLNGFIDYRNWERNPEKIDFFHNPNEIAKSYSPAEIESFSVSGEAYKSAIITLDDSPFKTESLKEDAKFNYITDTVFLLNLVNGEKSLYYFMDIHDKEHFFIANNSTYELLLYKTYLKRDELGNLSIFQNKKYVGQLSIYLQDCSTIQSKLADLKYDRKSMLNLFLTYYKCSKNKMVSQNKAVSKPYELGILAGLSFSKLKFFNGADYFSKANFPLSTNFSAGLFYNIIFPRNFGRMSLSNELLYYSFKTEYFYNEAVTTKIGLHYAMMNFLFRYKYPLQKVDFFLKSGLSFGYGFGETNYQKFEEVHLQRASESKAFSKMDKLYLGVNIGLGLKYKKYSIEGRYMYGFKKTDTLFEKSSAASSTSAAFLMLGYQL